MILDVNGACIRCGDSHCNGCKSPRELDRTPITAAGDVTNNKLQDWKAGLWSANETQKDRNTVVARNQAMLRDDSLYSGAARQERSIVVGPNVRLKIRPDYRFLQDQGVTVDREWAQEWGLKARRMWVRDMEDPTRNWMDASAKHTFSHFMGLAWMEWIGSGEVLIVSVPEDGPRERPITNSWAMIDPARLSTPTNRLDREDTVDGIQESRTGAPIAYYIADYHPELSDPTCRFSKRARSLIRRRNGQTGVEERWRRYTPRFEWGRPKTIHFYDKDRANLSRQKPVFAAAIKEHFSAEVYTDAAVDAAIRDARMAMWISSSDPHLWQAFATPGEDVGVNVNDIMGSLCEAKADYYKGNPLSIDDQIIPQLMPNDEIKTNALGSPSDNHPDFLRSMLMYGARALELSQQTFLGDASTANYSALRHATIMDWYSRMYKRDLLFDYVGKPIFVAWLEDKVAQGDLEMPQGRTRAQQLRFYLNNRQAFTNIQFYGPGQIGIDDQKQYNTLRQKLIDRTLSYEDYYFLYTSNYLEDEADQMLYEDDLLKNIINREATQSNRVTGSETGDIQ